MKTALITGASRGIGAACAAELARAGFRVVINYRDSRDAAEALAAALGGVAIRADVSKPDEVGAMFAVAGIVDTLVCNAGVALTGLFTDTADDWRRVFDVNVGGVINCARAAIPHMAREGTGSIITLSSIWGITGASCEAVYSASKAAVIGLTKSLAKELGPSGIRSNCVAPGVIDTDMNGDLSPPDLDALADVTPLGRVGTAEDVAGLVAFLASDAARFITGQVISPNGGILI
jgi:3-oxoacyl-[acyl-carrier protein] reductase